MIDWVESLWGKNIENKKYSVDGEGSHGNLDQ